jgi:hypothetical protein
VSAQGHGDLEGWEPLEEIALAYVVSARDQVAGHGMTWQELIDAQDDHNQTMIDAIDQTNPSLSAVIDELMSGSTDEAMGAWTGIVNVIFDKAQAIWEAG